MKTCKKCKISKEVTNFNKDKREKDAQSPNCRECDREIRNAWGRTPSGQKHRRGIKFKFYGIQLEKFNFLLEKQDGRCSICQREFSTLNRPVIDHDHTCCPSTPVRDKNQKGFASTGGRAKSCGKCVRGLLCTKCNTGLGMFEDNIQKLISAINYLQSYSPEDSLVDDLSLETLEISIGM